SAIGGRPGPQFHAREVNGLHKRSEGNRGFWRQSRCIDSCQEFLGFGASLFLRHLSQSAQLLRQSFALQVTICDTEIRIADIPHPAFREDRTVLFSSSSHSGFPLFCHLAFAAVRATSLRSAAVSFCLRTLAPLRPMADSSAAERLSALAF